MGDEKPIDPLPDLTRWVRTLLRRCGVKVVVWRDGSSGLVDVPAKYVAVIDQMHIAMMHLAIGEPLPEFEPEEPKPTKRRASRRAAKEMERE